MKLFDLLSPERVVVPLSGATLDEAAPSLVDALSAAGAVADPAHLHRLLAGTLPRDVVSAGPAFLLHFRTDAVPHLVVALGVADEPLHRADDPSKTARIVVLIVAPPEESSQFLRAISTLARALGREEVVQGLLAARSPEDVLAVAPFVDTEVHEDLAVGDVMVPQQYSVRPDTPLGDASELMLAQNLAAVPVVSDENEVLGMVTDRELLRFLLPAYVRRVSAEGRHGHGDAPDAKDPHELPVRDVMDRSVLCVSISQPLAEVANMILSRGVDQLPVVRDGGYVGLLTKANIIRRLLGR